MREAKQKSEKECKKCHQKSANTMRIKEEGSQGPLIRSLCKQIYDANEFAAEWVESTKGEREWGRETREKKKEKEIILPERHLSGRRVCAF